MNLKNIDEIQEIIERNTEKINKFFEKTNKSSNSWYERYNREQKEFILHTKDELRKNTRNFIERLHESKNWKLAKELFLKNIFSNITPYNATISIIYETDTPKEYLKEKKELLQELKKMENYFKNEFPKDIEPWLKKLAKENGLEIK
jgi:tetrahydrodipicolinate N-succinyltransferase